MQDKKSEVLPNGSATKVSKALTGEDAIIQRLREGVIHSDDPECVHNLRILIRRIRTAIRFYGTALEPELKALGEPLKDLFRTLGKVRDCDIALQAVCDFPPDARVEVQEKLFELRLDTKRELLAVLTLPNVLDECQRLRSRIAFALLDHSPSEMRQPILALHRNAVQSLRKLSSAWSLPEVHRFRRRTKRLRYALELYEPEFGKTGKEYVRGLIRHQNQLGKIVDLANVRGLLLTMSFASEATNKAVLREVKRIGARIEKRRESVIEAKKELSGPAWKKLRGTLLSKPEPKASDARTAL